MGASWRLLDTGAGDGAWNMAVDEALLEAHRQGLSPPTLRFYRWATPTLTLGYAQGMAGLDPAAIAEAGVALARRPTGGRAVLHAQDLTYAVVASGLPAGVAASYRVLAGALVDGLATLGVPLALVPGQARPGRSAACFAAATPADLVANGRKLAGAAQLRRGGAVLQHGTLYLTHPTALARRVLPDEPPVADLGGAAWADVAAAVAGGFARAFGVALAPGDLTAWEMDFAASRRARYEL